MGFREQQQYYGSRPFVGRSYDVSVTTTEATHELRGPMRYLVTNIGPNPCNLIVSETKTVDSTDAIIYPVGSGDRSEFEVWIGITENKTLKNSPNTLRAICGAGTATLRITEMSRR